MSISAESENRYDRQLRLWGNHGQQALEEAHVCLIGATAVGCEILKNLILPGIGSFTIIDDNLVQKSDLGSNFFVTIESVGKGRAETVTETLTELNPSVKGHFVCVSADKLLDDDQQMFQQFSIIICTEPRESLFLRLEQTLPHTPLILVFSLGMVGLIRCVYQEHTVIESHPDATLPDLRLDRPLQGLDELASSARSNILQLSPEMTSKDLVHIPWVLILHQLIQKQGHFPVNYQEKRALAQLVSQTKVQLLAQLNDDKSLDATNFDEAKAAINTAVQATRVPDQVQELFEDEKCTKQYRERETSGKSPECNAYVFWQAVAALKDFVAHEGEGVLPVRGQLPDMSADTERYLSLQRLYKERFDWAVQQMLSRLSHVASVTEQFVQLFVRNCYFLRVLRSVSLSDELQLSPAKTEDLCPMPQEEQKDEGLIWYLVLRACICFLQRNGRWPEHEDRDLQALRSCIQPQLVSCVPNDYLLEAIRAVGGQLHSVAAYLGGVAAQEAIKLITHQFVPISKPLIYNAISQSVSL
ncbi:NEDD8-activating enzyme E1 regulatory subunit, partial [Cichlidogyrus casuarinus]